MLIGYARVSKADGSQSLGLQRDALQAAGVDAVNVYHDFASGGGPLGSWGGSNGAGAATSRRFTLRFRR